MIESADSLNVKVNFPRLSDAVKYDAINIAISLSTPKHANTVPVIVAHVSIPRKRDPDVWQKFGVLANEAEAFMTLVVKGLEMGVAYDVKASACFGLHMGTSGECKSIVIGLCFLFGDLIDWCA